MSKNPAWFDTDKEGLAKLVEGRGKVFVLHELISNCWDTNTKRVEVSLIKNEGRPFADLMVRDEHPEGFKNLSHAFTLFAESERKGQSEKRGRFNLGEKLVLAVCRSATIQTTSGTLVFDEDGTRSKRAAKTDKGSVFMGKLRMNAEEFEEVCKSVKRLIAPAGVLTTFNNVVLPERLPIAVFSATLPTPIPDDEGVLRMRQRKTQVEVYEPLPGEPAAIYEMGIPVLDLIDGDRYSVNVMQKVPLSMQRDSVPPSYLRELRTFVLEAVAKKLTVETAKEAWVTDALQHPDIAPSVIVTALEKRFDKPIDKIAIFDPSDREANNVLVSKGFTVVAGGTLPAAAWDNIKRGGTIKPSGQIQPTPKPYSDDPDADPATVIPRADWTPAMQWVCDLSKTLAKELLNVPITVNMVKAGKHFSACYGASRREGIRRLKEHEEWAPGGTGCLDFNVEVLGTHWFKDAALSEVLALIAHELAHETEGNHLSERYHRALQDIAGKMTVFALHFPEHFKSRP